MTDPTAQDLLGEILDAGIVQMNFAPILLETADRLVEWEKLRDELMYNNRFFPQTKIDFERLRLLVSSLTANRQDVPTVWYRARLQPGEEAYAVADMGAPPKRIASHGRANPAGIPYLYLASTPQTAVSEIRPHTGEIACVCDFRIPDLVALVDLRHPRRMVSPFLLEDAEDICRMRSDLPFLERLGEELMRPVLPLASAIDYTPSQYLCEFIKNCGYRGVLYGSSVSDGINLALFAPEDAISGSVTQYRVSRVSIVVKNLSDESL